METLITYFTVPIINSQGGLKHSIKMKDLLDPLHPEKKRETKQLDAEYLKEVFNLKDCS